MNRALKKYFPIFVGPTLLAFLIAFIVPFFMGLYLSFTKFKTLDNAKWVGIDNYIAALDSDSGFLSALGFTVIVSVISIITVNLGAFTLAYLLTRKLRGTNFFRSVFFMPNLIGGIVLGFTWQVMLNAVLKYWGQTIVNDWRLGLAGLIMLVNWQLMGYMMIIYIAGLQNVPPELIEAAQIDGADGWLTLRNVTIPMVMPSITICLFLTLANTFKMFDQNLALTNGAPLEKTSMAALNIYKTMYNLRGRMGVAQAEAVIFFLIVSAIALIQLRATRAKEVDA
ncbi:Inner membrane ABC transporter permease protein ycjO [Actinomyces bovis]|uniref:Inner membrane ABC transporter permease protein ycjO n=1 Tax=Actinomyces bovis TaxID=1658 RepID=A0ABY1VNR0_9ACTO|nr:sugar ABC transporter permease [Actinomyces bovis]SPT53559.1 Inner membrane ABC transporter permease protein ycjO [Actinomyces bovis]VEG55539.1 Inner membrane ABC transporter permease protein ycjO [Actinomyces israelii]